MHDAAQQIELLLACHCKLQWPLTIVSKVKEPCESRFGLESWWDVTLVTCLNQ